MDWKKEKEYIGHRNQIFPVKRYTLQEGKSRGVNVIEIGNGNGLNMIVLPDRGMDIYQLSYKGINLNYMTKVGITNSTHYDKVGNGWLKSFAAGFLTTCGLQNTGPGFIEDNKIYGLHGNVGNIPSQNINVKFIEDDKNPSMCITGIVEECEFMGTYLSLERSYSIQYLENKIVMRDIIKNEGYKIQPVMILYHFNIGYPLLHPNSTIMIPTKKVMPRTINDKVFVEEYLKIEEPQDNWNEQVFYHELDGDEKGKTSVGIRNDLLNICLKISFDTNLLDHFIQWKMFQKGEYVLGLEPCNSTIDGRVGAESNGSLKYLKPNETFVYEIEIDVVQCMKNELTYS